jgi:hypothetical protein
MARPYGARHDHVGPLSRYQFAGSAHWHKRHQHRHAASVSAISFGVEFCSQKAFFDPRLDPQAESDERRAKAAGRCRLRRGGGENGEHQSGVNRMADPSIGPSVDDAMVFLSGNRA